MPMFVNRGLLLRFVALFPLSPSRTHFEILLSVFNRTIIPCLVQCFYVVSTVGHGLTR